jgi:hypothetical protein
MTMELLDVINGQRERRDIAEIKYYLKNLAGPELRSSKQMDRDLEASLLRAHSAGCLKLR